MNNHFKIALCFIIIPLISFSQKEWNRWYFGENAGIDFSGGAPVAVTDGMLNASEGGASICDTAGNLLFYTDGVLVWAKDHSVMTNGTGLASDAATRTATQSAIIIPKPESTDTFFVFTVDKVIPSGASQYSNELHYSIVDMTKQGGLGEVIFKNITLSPGVKICEKIAATRHANGCDAWVLVHEWKSNKFYAYQVTSAGVNPVPVVSSIGQAYLFRGGIYGNNGSGQMKISIDGKKVLSVKNETDSIEVFDFNNATGVVSNPIYLYNAASPSRFEQPYGAEFSPDGSKIYVTNFVSATCINNCSRITQFNLSLGSQAAILASATHIRTADPTISSLQLGPDGKIYCATQLDNYLCAINSPNLAGVSCNFVENAVSLSGKTSVLNLPSLYNHYCINSSLSVTPQSAIICAGNSTTLKASGTGPFNWSPAGGLSSTSGDSVLASPMTTTTYTVTNGSISKTVTITVKNPLNIDAGSGQNLCHTTSASLNALDPSPNAGVWTVGTGSATFSSSTNPFATVSGLSYGLNTLVWTVSNSPCPVQKDSVFIYISNVIANAGDSATICSGGSITLTGSGAGGSGSYSWLPSASLSCTNCQAPTASPTVNTTYTLVATDSLGCSDTSVVNISIGSSLNVSAGNDITLCSGADTILAASGGMNYSWQPSAGLSNPGISNPVASPTASVTYTVTVDDGAGCTGKDSINITIAPSPSPPVVKDTTICAGLPVTLTATSTDSVYWWSLPSTGTLCFSGSTFTTDTLFNDTAFYAETSTGSCKSGRVKVNVKVKPGPTFTTSSQNINCYNDSNGTATINITSGGSYTYNWLPYGGTNNSASGLAAGTYTVVISNTDCSFGKEITISGPPAITISYIATPDSCGKGSGSASISVFNANGTYSITWQPGGLTGTQQSNLAMGDYSVTVNDSKGCSSTDTITIPNLANFSIKTSSVKHNNCYGGSSGSAGITIIGGTGPFSYSWQPGGYTDTTISGLQSGIYTVTVSSANGCSGISNITISEPPEIKNTKTPTNTSCAGKTDGKASINITGGTSPYSISWTGTTDTSTARSGLAKGTYSYTITDKNGCIKKDSIAINDGAAPVINAGKDVVIVKGTSAQLNVTGGTNGATYLWTPATGLSCSNCQAPIASPTATTTYMVLYTDANGCAGSDSVTVEVFLDYDVYLPTAFTPNNDGMNDTLFLRGRGIKEFTLVIYNRWGSKVFESKDMTVGWNGTHNNEPCDEAVFYYNLSGTFYNGERFYKKGNITLLR